MKDALAFITAALVMMLILHVNVVREQARLTTSPAIARTHLSGELNPSSANNHSTPHQSAANGMGTFAVTRQSTRLFDRTTATHAFENGLGFAESENSKTDEINSAPRIRSETELLPSTSTGAHEEESQCDLLAWIGPLGTESMP